MKVNLKGFVYRDVMRVGCLRFGCRFVFVLAIQFLLSFQGFSICFDYFQFWNCYVYFVSQRVRNGIALVLANNITFHRPCSNFSSWSHRFGCLQKDLEPGCFAGSGTLSSEAGSFQSKNKAPEYSWSATAEASSWFLVRSVGELQRLWGLVWLEWWAQSTLLFWVWLVLIAFEFSWSPRCRGEPDQSWSCW